MTDQSETGVEYEELEQKIRDLLETWENEIAVENRRYRNWDGHLQDEYELKGKVRGMTICRHELQRLINDE